jgi:transcriptional regulator with XRE-family HTH domain
MMMTAENQGEAELTNQQKYNRLRPRQTVEVRLLSHAGADERWFRAKIKDTNKEGAYCQIVDSPGSRFFHWREIRVCDETGLPPRASATLGEVAQAHLRPVAELPRREPLPAPPALRAALVPAAPPSPPAPLVRLTRPEQQQQAQPDEPSLSAGEMIRQARQAAGLTQDALAAKLAALMNDRSMNNKRLSTLETGSRAPSENEQLAIVEALGIDLAQLLAACERDAKTRERELKNKRGRESAQRRRLERAQAEGREIALRTSRYRPRDAAPLVPAATKPSTRASREARLAPRSSGQTLEDLIDALIAIVPMPLDSDERKNWFRCARELFALSGGR